MKTSKWFKKNARSLEGKTVAVSGSTGGLGERLCEHLSALGAQIWFLDRNEDKARALENRLKEKNPTLKSKYIKLDLSDMENVMSVTDILLENTPDILIFNAGIYHVPRYVCDSGYNNVFQVNFISPYYMANALKNRVWERGGKIVAVGSIAHDYSQIDLSDIDFSSRKKSSKVYGNSKRFLMFSLYGLFEGERGLSVVHPGITFTNITAHYPRVIFALIKHPMKVIFMSPKKAALSILSGIFDDCQKNEWIGPRFFDVWGMPKKKTLKTCKDEEAEKICFIAKQINETLIHGKN